MIDNDDQSHRGDQDEHGDPAYGPAVSVVEGKVEFRAGGHLLFTQAE